MPAVKAFPPPPAKEKKEVSSSRALPLVVSTSEVNPAFKDLTLEGAKRKRNQKEKSRPAAAPVSKAIPSQERRVKQKQDSSSTVSSGPASSGKNIHQVEALLHLIFSVYFFIMLFLFSAVSVSTVVTLEAPVQSVAPSAEGSIVLNLGLFGSDQAIVPNPGLFGSDKAFKDDPTPA